VNKTKRSGSVAHRGGGSRGEKPAFNEMAEFFACSK
jgi:hypothetical protein